MSTIFVAHLVGDMVHETTEARVPPLIVKPARCILDLLGGIEPPFNQPSQGRDRQPSAGEL